MMIRSLVLLLAAFATPVQAAKLRVAIVDGAHVGHKRAGLLCLPNGGIRWDRSFRPDLENIAAAVSEAFGSRAERVSIEVTGARMNLCQPDWGALGIIPGDRSKLKGRIEVEARWTLRSAQGCTLPPQIVTVTSAMRATSDMTGGIPALIEGALAEGSREAARQLGPETECGTLSAAAPRLLTGEE